MEMFIFIVSIEQFTEPLDLPTIGRQIRTKLRQKKYDVKQENGTDSMGLEV